jgi:chitin disaccharide deacetylase
VDKDGRDEADTRVVSVRDDLVMRQLIVSADDFGLDPAVNAAVEEAHRDGILTSASLMVAAPAAADAVALAHRLRGLRVGLHLVLVDGRPISPPAAVRSLVDDSGEFGRNLGRAGLRFFLAPSARRQLAAEIHAQFEAFAATGLTLDHVNAHKHLHLHPTVASLVLRIGREFGMSALRVPSEPAVVLRRAYPGERARRPFYDLWVRHLRRRARRAGIVLNDHVFGLAWSGNMVEERVLRLLPCLPDGVSELYFHPASTMTPALERAMPGYHPVDELAALTSAAVRARIAALDIALTSYGALSGPA